MKPAALQMNFALALVIGAVLAAGPVLAEKPSWAGAGKGGHEHGGKPPAQGGHFEEQHRAVVRQYYEEQYRGRSCPPGLAKKQNGCLPPGQAKKWQIGRPLPGNVIYHEVPHQLVVQIGLPPAGHRYVRVAGDILMIAVGTGMVIDAIQDLGR